MKRLLFTMLCCALFNCWCTRAFSQDKGDDKRGFNCGTMDGYWDRIKKDDKFRQGEEKLNGMIEAYVKNLRETGEAALFTDVIRIPVVVHVVHNTTTENISDAQIQSQIDALNRDFRRANADISSVPAAFSGLTSDLRIEFELASRDPDCNATNGITRTATTVTGFDNCDVCTTPETRNPVKFSSTGGRDGWPSDQYLNLWVCDLVGGLAGYASFPEDLAARPTEDGVVMDYQYFGTTGTVSSPFHLGRVCAHEIGHWLSLRHIWGDDTAGPIDICDGTDFVDDTPNQAGFNSGCPGFPHTSCGNGPNGDMFMNYMDYVDNTCMVMFSHGQSERVVAALSTVRSSIIGSPGLVPPDGVPGPDLWSQDTNEDIGDEPNNLSPDFYRSNDIWVRNTNDGFTNHEHLNPVYNPSSPNYIYVRVRNRSCSGSQAGEVKLYWAFAAAGLSWPAPWDGSVASPALMGNPVGTQSVTVDGGEFEILEFEWYPPNPEDYASFGADKSHFCLLSRIETSSSAPFGMTHPETGNLGNNVKNNNNIAWKNVTVVGGSTGGGFTLIVGNYSTDEMKTRLTFNNVKNAASVFEWGQVFVELPDKLYDKWKEGGMKQKGVQQVSTNVFQLLRPSAYLGDFNFKPMEIYPMHFKFVPFGQTNITQVYKLKVEQLDLNTNSVFGGEIYTIKQLGTGLDDGKEGKTINVQEEDEKDKVPVTFYPNPSRGSITMVNKDGILGDALISVYDQVGDVKFSQKHTFKSDRDQLNLDLGKLDAGLYIMKIETKNGSYKMKVFIQ